MVSNVTFPARDGRSLSGRIRAAIAPAIGAAVLCHPHPDFGGNMDVWLLPTIGRRLAEKGWTTLRFDFRPGVGNGTAATGDLAGAVDFVTTQGSAGNGPVALVGWSFGALVGLLHGVTDPRVTHWVGIAPAVHPAAGLDLAPVPPSVAHWTARRTVIIGEHEQFFDDPRPAHPHHTRVIGGADHFFFDRDDEVADAVVEALS